MRSLCTATKSSLRSPQLEKARAQHRDLMQPKIKYKFIFKKTEKIVYTQKEKEINQNSLCSLGKGREGKRY